VIFGCDFFLVYADQVPTHVSVRLKIVIEPKVMQWLMHISNNVDHSPQIECFSRPLLVAIVIF